MYYVMWRGEPIGRSKLERRDRAMAIAFGDFEPLPTYESVREIFLLFIEAHEESADHRQHVEGLFRRTCGAGVA